MRSVEDELMQSRFGSMINSEKVGESGDRIRVAV